MQYTCTVQNVSHVLTVQLYTPVSVYIYTQLERDCQERRRLQSFEHDIILKKKTAWSCFIMSDDGCDNLWMIGQQLKSWPQSIKNIWTFLIKIWERICMQKSDEKIDWCILVSVNKWVVSCPHKNSILASCDDSVDIILATLRLMNRLLDPTDSTLLVIMNAEVNRVRQSLHWIIQWHYRQVERVLWLSMELLNVFRGLKKSSSETRLGDRLSFGRRSKTGVKSVQASPLPPRPNRGGVGRILENIVSESNVPSLHSPRHDTDQYGNNVGQQHPLGHTR